MNLQAIIAETQADVELQRQGHRVVASVDGREYDLEVHQLASGLMLRDSEGRVFNCRVEGRVGSGETVEVFVGADRYSISLIDPKRLRGTTTFGAHADGAARITAPMPGKVVRVLVAQGASVEAGAGIIVVEAMKMQNEMKSPKAGIVTALNVEVGATVNRGDVLAVIE